MSSADAGSVDQQVRFGLITALMLTLLASMSASYPKRTVHW
jgi:hypothetical protein